MPDDNTVPDPAAADAGATDSPAQAAPLDQLANGTVAVLFIDRTPRGEAKRWTDADGRTVQSFLCKFGKDAEPWSPGDLVNAHFIVTQRGGKTGLMVSDAFIGDIRNADTFYLDLDPAEAEMLRQQGMALIDADVEVAGSRTYVVSNMFNWPARLHRINAIQSRWDGVSALETGKQVLIEGKVVLVETGEADYTNAVFPSADIELPNGRVVTIELTNGRDDYTGGPLEILYPSDLQVGDIAQINATYSNASSWSNHEHRPPTLHASFCRNAYLITPSPERTAFYRHVRSYVAGETERLRGLEGAEFRSSFGKLVNRCVRERGDRGSFPLLLMTNREIAEIKQLAEEKFPNPVERPLATFDRQLLEAVDIRKKYGADIMSMSRSQYYDFCLDVANGRVPIRDLSHGSPDYPYRVMVDEYSQEECFEVLRQAVEYWVPRTAGKEVVHRSGEFTDPDRQIPFDYEYMAEQSIAYLEHACEGNVSRAEYLYDFAVERSGPRQGDSSVTTRCPAWNTSLVQPRSGTSTTASHG